MALPSSIDIRTCSIGLTEYERRCTFVRHRNGESPGGPLLSAAPEPGTGGGQYATLWKGQSEPGAKLFRGTLAGTHQYASTTIRNNIRE